MLTRRDLDKYKNSLDFNLGQTQADYIQHVFLYFLYRKIKDELVFKGGTCLQKTFGLGRFSEDLDFTMRGKVNIKTIAENITDFGYDTEIVKEKKERMNTSFLLKAKGPLYDGTEKSLAYVRVEISTREEVILRPDIKAVTPLYHDLPPYTLSIMKIEEIMAEKVRAIITREKARDIYDLWFLLRKGVKADFVLIDKKLNYYNTEFNFKIFSDALQKRNRIWKRELKPLVARLPEFKEVINEIQMKLLP